MKTTVKTITPEWAAKILETRNPLNRPISRGTVETYAHDMKNGRWAVTHQGIAFDPAGELIDGQHRLSAVVLAGKPVDMLVASDVEVDHKNGIGFSAKDVIDRQRMRGIGQQLSLSHGWKNGNKVAAVARSCALFATGIRVVRNSRINTVQTLAILAPMERSVLEMVKISMLNQRAWNAKAASMMVLYHTVFPEQAITFAEKFYTHEGCRQGDPVLALARWMASSNTCEKTGSVVYLERLTACAIHASHHNDPMKILREKSEAIDWFMNINPTLLKRIRAESGLTIARVQK